MAVLVAQNLLAMASLHASAQKALAKSKDRRRRDQDEMEVDEHENVSVDTQPKLRNKQRVLLLSSRGITYRMRHLMNDLEVLLPHVKKG